MDAFVRRLVERLHDAARPLSRNRHFHTFDTPEGKRALRMSRRLKSLQRDILASAGEGLRTRVSTAATAEGEARVEVSFERVRGRRVALLEAQEFELLLALPGMREALVTTSGSEPLETRAPAAPRPHRP